MSYLSNPYVSSITYTQLPPWPEDLESMSLEDQNNWLTARCQTIESNLISQNELLQELGILKSEILQKDENIEALQYAQSDLEIEIDSLRTEQTNERSEQDAMRNELRQAALRYQHLFFEAKGMKETLESVGERNRLLEERNRELEQALEKMLGRELERYTKEISDEKDKEEEEEEERKEREKKEKEKEKGEEKERREKRMEDEKTVSSCLSDSNVNMNNNSDDGGNDDNITIPVSSVSAFSALLSICKPYSRKEMFVKELKQRNKRVEKITKKLEKKLNDVVGGDVNKHLEEGKREREGKIEDDKKEKKSQ